MLEVVQRQKEVLFNLGRVFISSDAQWLISVSEDAKNVLERHSQGDWGNVEEHRARLNNIAIQEGGWFISRFILSNGRELWIQTQNSNYTTVLTGEEWYGHDS